MNDKYDSIRVENEYGVDQIDSLDGLEAVRKRPGMYIGSTSQRGVTHLVFETIDNSIDEFVAGYGTEIYLTIEKNGKVIVKDSGRGIPVGPHSRWKKSDGTPLNTLTGVLTKLHAGGKFNKAGSGYSQSSGLHGVGVKAVNALSEYFVATVKRNGKIYQQKFSEGNPTTDVTIIGDTNETGTTIEYLPDKKIFKQTLEPSEATLISRLEEIVALNKGLKFIYNNEITGTQKEFYSEEGIISYVKQMTEDKKLLFNDVFYFRDKILINNSIEFIGEVSFIYDDEEKPHETFKSFANNINTYEGGYHLQGFRNGFKNWINDYGIKNGLIKNDIELRYLMDGIYAVISVKLPEIEFEGQTKTKLGNEEAQEAVSLIVKSMFDKFIHTRKTDVENIIMRASKVKEAEEAARKARQNARAANKVTKEALPGKLQDCGNKNGYRELIVCEGDSASGSIKQGRFSKFQAVLPLRGKVLNTEKSDFDKMLKSEAIRNIMAAIGTGFGAKFDLKKARYDKIIIMTDADDDGSHITTLILTLFYNYMRPLLEEGYVYLSKPPLYRVLLKDKTYKYVATDGDLKEFKRSHGNKMVNVQRFKG